MHPIGTMPGAGTVSGQLEQRALLGDPAAAVELEARKVATAEADAAWSDYEVQVADEYRTRTAEFGRALRALRAAAEDLVAAGASVDQLVQRYGRQVAAERPGDIWSPLSAAGTSIRPSNTGAAVCAAIAGSVPDVGRLGDDICDVAASYVTPVGA